MGHESTRDSLRRVPLFAGLDPVDLDRIAGLSRILHLQKKQVLFTEGEPYRGMFVVLDGLVVVYKLSEDGRMLILHVCRQADALAEVPLFEERNAGYPAHARATRPSEVLFLPRATFTPFLKSHPAVAWELARGLATRLKELSLQLEGVTLSEVTERLARYLVREVEAAGLDREATPAVTLPLAKGSLASYLGTVHETLSRSLSRLVKERVLRVAGPEITILDLDRLREVARRSPGPTS